jgi:ethanolamine ammonia-lyase small subunit
MIDHRCKEDPWARLRHVTPARIALGRAGGSLPTGRLLEFQLAHALARDAVHQPFEVERLVEEISGLGLAVVRVASGAGDRETYLLRPDLGRGLGGGAGEILERHRGEFDVAIVVSDGLSALAAHRQGAAVLGELAARLLGAGFALAPIVVVPFARVAIEDEIGERLGAKAAVILLGERPGLGAADSLGAYLVYEPRVGKTDAERNCVSNIRAEGLAPGAAVELLFYLISQAIRRRISGVELKDDRQGALEGTPDVHPGLG